MKPKTKNTSDQTKYFVVASSIGSVVMAFLLFLCLAAHLENSETGTDHGALYSARQGGQTAIVRVDTVPVDLKYRIWPK